MELHQEIDRLVKGVWKDRMKEDYDDCVFWEESVLKSAFYHHLRERIRKERTLSNVVLYPEMRVRSPKGEPLRIDLAIVELQECGIKIWEECERRWRDRGSCVERLIAVLEFKHWERIYEKPLERAIEKLERHFQNGGVYHFDDNSKDRKLLRAERLYFGIVLDRARSILPSRKEIIRKSDSSRKLQLLIGANVGEKLEFKCL